MELVHAQPQQFPQMKFWNDPLHPFSELLEHALTGSSEYRSLDGCIHYKSLSVFSTENTEWASYVLSIQKAASKVGFSRGYSGKLMGAIQELRHNIVDHSQRTDTGYVVFSASSGKFEFVVADRGVGVLNSLRNNPDYADLQDHGLALEKALTNGVSRHPSNTGHGTGFKPTINGLANISQTMRFRSGDHAREYNRFPSGEIVDRTVQKSFIDGFLVAVACDAAMV